jgi:hypothetical protein
MAGIMDLLNQGLGGLNTPTGQLGIQMLLNSGQMQGNPGFGQRMGSALGGMQQMQAEQQQMEMQKLLRQQQQQELYLRQAGMMQQQEQRKAVQEAVKSDPNFLANNPQARALLEATGDMGFAGDLAKLSPVQKPPTMPGVFERQNADGTMSQQIYNPQTGGYDEGPAYTPTDRMRAEAYVQKTQQDMQYKPQEVNLQQQQANTAAERVQAMVTESARKQAGAQLDKRVKVADLTNNYRGANSQLDDAISLADELLKEDSGLDRNFGLQGFIPNAPGMDAANARAKMERLKAVSGLTELVRLGNQGIRLTPVSDNDIRMVQSSAMNLDKAQDAASARQELNRYKSVLMRAKNEASENYNAITNAYNPPSQQQQPAQGQYQQINSQSEYDALPSGAVYIDPDDGKPYRKP